MRCCVPNCKNDSRQISKSQGITFHVFPTERSLRFAWIRALGKEDWVPKKRSAVCSEHFLCEDLYETSSGLRKVKAGAVPMVLLKLTGCQYGESASPMVCRICLVMDTKLFSIRMNKLEQAYEHLTGISVQEEERLPQKLCVECAQRLFNFSRFRNKSLKANSLMVDILKQRDYITLEHIKSINRENNQLISPLTIKNLESVCYDNHEPTILPEEPETVNIDLKQENEIFLTEEVIDKEDSSDNYDLVIQSDNYSSDDCLPLEECKTVKEKKERRVEKSVKRAKKNENPDNIIRRMTSLLNDGWNENVATRTDSTVDADNVDILKRVSSCKYTNALYKCTTCFTGFYEEDAYNTHMARHNNMTIQNIKNIIRENRLLISPLTINNTQPEQNDHCYIQEKPAILTEPTAIDIDIKQENENSSEEVIDKMAEDNNGDYEDFVIQSDNFSSDDSLPLEKCKTVKKKKKQLKISMKRAKKIAKPVEPKIDRRRKPLLNDDLNEMLFTITDLTLEEQLAEILKRQESSNYKNAVYKCTACFKGFLDEDAYNSHIARHTNEAGEHPCAVCKTHFKHPHALRKHITAHHTQRFSCKQCNYVTTHRQTARLHERWHNGTKYSCPHCNHEFLKFTTYMGHIRIKHPSDFVCELCGYSFVSAKGIELHKKLKHRLDNTQVPEDGPYCELCNVRFVSAEAHKKHISVSARHNTGSDKNREANKPTRKVRKTKEEKETERRSRELHKEDDKKRPYPSQIRKAEGPIPCEQCGLQLEDSRAYHGHFRRMHPDKNRTNYPSMKSPCMCEVCGRMFQSYALLKDHTWVHTGERPFKCDSCDKSFRMKQRLVAHRRVHSDERASYVCALCGKHFSTHSNRQRHMFIHTGLKPFKCEMCDKGFKHASEKRAHITYVHLKKPWPKRARGKRRSDTRPGHLPQQGQDMDLANPIWPNCDPEMIVDKPVYYNVKL